MPNLKAPWALAGTVDPCCCPPETCCLYPGGDPTPAYPYTDLPATVEADIVYEPGVGQPPETITMTRQFYASEGTEYAYKGTNYAGDIWISPNFLSAGLWVEGFGLSNADCLIGLYRKFTDSPVASFTVRDVFSSAYLVDLGAGDTGTVTRTSNICQWVGVSAGLVPILLEYDSAVYKWKVNGVEKDTNQSAPDAGTGNYGAYNVS